MKKALKVVTPLAPVKLDLACGQNCREGFKGVDLWAPDAEKVDLLLFPWRWKDESVDELHCSHFVEHIPARDLKASDTSGLEDLRWSKRVGQDMFFAFFDECHRILKPGGTMTVIVPALQSVRAFQDPTHRRFIPQETFFYLNAEWRKQQKLDHYRVRCDFAVNVGFSHDSSLSLRAREVQERMLRETWNTIYDWHVVLTKPEGK